MVSVNDGTQLCPCRKNSHRQYVDEWPWLYSNKTLFVKQTMRQIWLLALDDRTLPRKIWSSRHTLDLEESIIYPPQYEGTLLWFSPCSAPSSMVSLVFLLAFLLLLPWKVWAGLYLWWPSSLKDVLTLQQLRGCVILLKSVTIGGDWL